MGQAEEISSRNSIRRARGEELTRDDVLGKNVWEMFPAHVGSVIYQKYHEAMRGQKTMEFEARSPVTDRWIEGQLYPSEEGLSVYYRDITERKRAEEQLAYHAQLLENIHDAVIATDERFVLTAAVHVSGREANRLTDERETALYRIMQEAQNNVAKHAHARNVSIVLQRSSDHVSLIIEDDGVGFDREQVVAARDKQLGLVGMRERASLLGGTLDVESQAGPRDDRRCTYSRAGASRVYEPEITGSSHERRQSCM